MAFEKTGTSGKLDKRIICGSIVCLFLLAFTIVTSYYGIEFARELNKAHSELQKRVSRLEIENKESIDVLVRTVASVNNITGALEIFFNEHHKHHHVGAKGSFRGPRTRVRREESAKEIEAVSSGEDSTEESLQRTIHGFRREMFSLNDRLRLLLRYGEKTSERGIPGLPGPPGKVGPSGPPGVNGRDGYHGTRGEPGIQGPIGPEGPQGPPGKDGLNGINGIPGLPGYKGEKGDRGQMGLNGRDGADGNQGPIGRTGSPGRPGIRGEKGEKGECIIEENKPIEIEEPAKMTDAHIVYTMWGSSNCPSTSNIIYSGHIGMSKYELDNDQSTGSNLVCVPIPSKRYRRQADDATIEKNGREEVKPPEDVDYVNTTKFTVTLNVTKNETTVIDVLRNVSEPFTLSPLATPKSIPITSENTSEVTEPILMNYTGPTPSVGPPGDRFVPKYAELVGTRKYISCSVCDALDRSEKLMIPASVVCPDTWSVEYQGYLMNYHHGTAQANLICVNDQALGVSPSSDAGIREIISMYLSHVKTDCTTFPCPPLNYQELLKCVVCSK